MAGESSPDAVLKELSNPFYGYSTQESAAEEALYQQPAEGLKELTNPTYDLAEPATKPEKIVPNPTYIPSPQRKQGTATTSNGGEYSEVPAYSEGPIYDAPAND